MDQPGSTSDEKISLQLEILQKKLGKSGQDVASYLEGLHYSKLTNYWDYIHLETLLSLQNPKTDLPDEIIFITYHHITELYFKLILLELSQLVSCKEITDPFLVEKLKRLNRYVDNLVYSFDIMVKGLEKEQFLKFRLSILPASGFQSVQFRMIEIYSTDLYNLVDKDIRETLQDELITEELYEHIYWKKGATELQGGTKTLTLEQFEEKYSHQLLQLALEMKNKNLNRAIEDYLAVSTGDKSEIIDLLREFDLNVNINWVLSHYKSAAKHLQNRSSVLASTGGTNWQQYLPPRFQKKMFFPSLWSNEEKEEWGKVWVEKTLA